MAASIDLQNKLSSSSLSALLAHLGQNDPAASSTNTTLCPKGSTQGISDKELATQGLNLVDHQHVRNTNAGVDEQFGMSQFWYTSETATALAKEALSLGGRSEEIVGVKRIAFVSCPSAFKAAMDLNPDPEEYELFLFEFDTRFGDVYGDQFVFFDFNSPYMHSEYVEAFDYVMADPPYLVDSCMKKTVDHMKMLRRDETTPMGFSTGTVMAEEIFAHAQFRESKFHPEHQSKLGNEFSFFTNYEPEQLQGWYPLDESLSKEFNETYFKKTARTRTTQDEEKK